MTLKTLVKQWQIQGDEQELIPVLNVEGQRVIANSGIFCVVYIQ